MKIHKISVNFDNETYWFNMTLGLLMKKQCTKNRNSKLSKHAERAVNLNNHPLLLKKPKSVIQKENAIAKIYARILVSLCKRSFLLGYFFSRISLRIFSNAEEAVVFFRSIYPQRDQKNLCLPRSLFVSATSKQFKNKGNLFIGVFLPTTQMHAWTIEDEVQPDIMDDIWILYKPVLVICR